MRKIKLLAKQIREELCDAEKYAKLAVECKDGDPQLSNMYRQLAEQELDHAEMEHTQAVRIIRDQQTKGVQTPPEMQAIWEWEHEEMLEHKADIMRILSMY